MSDKQHVPLTMLIVGGNADTLNDLSLLLQEKAEIFQALSGHSALETARRNVPDLVVLDTAITDMDALALCAQLKGEVPQCTVLLLTQDESAANAVAALDCGAADYIAKPLNAAVLNARVDTQLKFHAQNRLLEKLIRQDGLTGLFNRGYFDDQCELEFYRHRRQKLPIGISLVTIDHFEDYASTFGPQAADECIKRIAHALSAATRRPAEVVARFGLAEFAVILPNCSQLDAKKYGAWICETIRGLALPFPSSPTAPVVTISAGLIAATPSVWSVLPHMIARADLARQRAEADGFNQFFVAE